LLDALWAALAADVKPLAATLRHEPDPKWGKVKPPKNDFVKFHAQLLLFAGPVPLAELKIDPRFTRTEVDVPSREP
jgi:hypothetical protein